MLKVPARCDDLHLMVEHLGFPGLGLGNERFIENIEYILANTLQLCLDLLTVITNSADMLV